MMAELVRVNKMESCYLRPIGMCGYGDVGVYGQKDPHRYSRGAQGVGVSISAKSASAVTIPVVIVDHAERKPTEN